MIIDIQSIMLILSLLFPVISIALGLQFGSRLVRYIGVTLLDRDYIDIEREPEKPAPKAPAANSQPDNSLLINIIAICEYLRSWVIPESCPKCGAPNSEHARSCKYCGSGF